MRNARPRPPTRSGPLEQKRGSNDALAPGLKLARVEIFPDDYSGGADADNADHLAA
jgi:hypothetical protein